MLRELHAGVRERSAQAAEQVAILYGGSMKPDNAVELMAQGEVTPARFAIVTGLAVDRPEDALDPYVERLAEFRALPLVAARADSRPATPVPATRSNRASQRIPT